MKGDFSRITFDPARHFSRVLMQQGRVQLDADFNEQAAILLDCLRKMMADLIGPYGRPEMIEGAVNDAFKVSLDKDYFVIAPGRYYVDGVLCENELQLPCGKRPETSKAHYVYLDVWERHISYVQDGRIQEKALGGPDTCSRAKVEWQVRLAEAPAQSFVEKRLRLLEGKKTALENRLKEKPGIASARFAKTEIIRLTRQADLLRTPAITPCLAAKAWIDGLPKLGGGCMRARLQPDRSNDDACSVAPESRYRGVENQLYRIEVHRGGSAWNGAVDDKGNPSGNAAEAAAFKWSRDNGSIVFPIIRQKGAVAHLQSLGRDERTSLKIGDWVEIMDDEVELQGVPGTMAQVEAVEPVEMKVTLKQPAGAAFAQWKAYEDNDSRHPLLRRWDQRASAGQTLQLGALLIAENDDPDVGWIGIEDGIEVQFQPVESEYRTGDYWLIPARVATGKIEWQPVLDAAGHIQTDENGNEIPEALPPFGIEHHYAPLAVTDPGNAQPTDCRRAFSPLPFNGV
jgi:hypothetical protein